MTSNTVVEEDDVGVEQQQQQQHVPIIPVGSDNKATTLLTAGYQPMLPLNSDMVQWRLYHPIPRYISAAQLLEKPLCKFWNVHICNIWISSHEQFTKYHEDSLRRRRERYTPSHKHGRCPASATDTVTVWLREWHSGWDGVLNGGAGNLASCPQKCEFVKQETSTSAIVLHTHQTAYDFIGTNPDRFEISGEPKLIRATLEQEDLQHTTGSTSREQTLQNTDLLLSWTRNSDVWINYMYAWSHFANPKCVGPLAYARHTSHSIMQHFEACLVPVPTMEELESDSKDFIVGFISNCGGGGIGDVSVPGLVRSKYLKEFLDALQSLTKRGVFNYGNCHRTANAATEPGGGKETIMPKFKFSMSFENSIREDYLSEKLFQSVVYGTLPVVFGPPETGQLMPGGDASYINALDFKNPRDLAQFLVELDRDHTRYLDYFAWRTDVSRVNEEFASALGFHFVGGGMESFICRLCVVYAKEFCGIDHVDKMLLE